MPERPGEAQRLGEALTRYRTKQLQLSEQWFFSGWGPQAPATVRLQRLLTLGYDGGLSSCVRMPLAPGAPGTPAAVVRYATAIEEGQP